MGTLWTALEAVPDHRTAKGRRYSLASLLGISLAAMLSGANALLAIARWGARLTPKGLEAFGITRGRAPCHATYPYMFRSLQAADLGRALRSPVQAGTAGHVAMDGKRLRGSQHHGSPGVHTSDEGRPGEIRPREVRLGEVHAAFRVLRPPGIPDSNSLPYSGKILVIGHMGTPAVRMTINDF